jgi:glycosyltransferase involved in cell wall biosynthesis
VRIVAFPFHDQRKGEVEGIRWRDGHLLETMAANPAIEELLVVDRPVSLAERIWTRRPAFVQGRAVAERRTGLRSARLTVTRPGMTVLDIGLPDTLGPVLRRRGWWFDVFAQPFVLDTLAWAADRVVGPRPTVIAWTPTVAAGIEALEPERLLFDSLDNWLIHPTLRRHADRATEAYARVLPRADAVVASAPASATVLRKWADRVRVVPNGVDPDRFTVDQPRPDDLPPGPIVGYAGSLAARIDAGLVAEVAGALPNVAFVFIGRMMDRSATRAMLGIPNVHVLGNRHYDLLPAYVRHFDIAWIPHAVGPGETGGDPIKLYEYWAASRQVVATRIDGLERWATQLHLVSDAGEARAAIEGLLSGRRRPTPTAVPPDRTWTAIADELLGLLAGDGRGGPGAQSSA